MNRTRQGKRPPKAGPRTLELAACRLYGLRLPGHFRENPKSNNNKQGIRNAVPTIYKISPASAWREAERQGVYKGSADDLRDGFIHFSTAAQVAETARKHYFGQTGLFLIAVDADALGDALRWERFRSRRRTGPATRGGTPASCGKTSARSHADSRQAAG